MWEPFDPVSYFAHVILGVIGLAGAVWALSVRKGSRGHVRAGWVFITGVGIAAFTVFVFSFTQLAPGALANAVLVCALLCSAILALKERTPAVAAGEWSCSLFTFATILLLSAGVVFLSQRGGFLWVGPATALLVSVIFLVGDMRFYRLVAEERKQRRVARHLTRLLYCVASAVAAPFVSFADELGMNQVYMSLAPNLIWPLLVLAFRPRPVAPGPKAVTAY